MTPRPTPGSAAESAVTAPAPGATQRLHLAAAGVSVVLDVTEGRIPALLHWGADLGMLGAAGLDAVCTASIEPVPHNAVDVPVRVGILPQQSDGWIGRQGLTGSRPDGSGWAPRLATQSISVDGTPLRAAHAETGAALVRFELADEELGLAVALEVELLPTGLLRQRATLTNTAASPYALEELTLTVPVPGDADELLDFAGRWGKERTPQRSTFTVGTHLRENRRGRTGPIPRMSCMQAVPASASARARSGACTPRSPATTATSPSRSTPATGSWAAARCWCPARWRWARMRSTRAPGCMPPTGRVLMRSPLASTATCGGASTT